MRQPEFLTFHQKAGRHLAVYLRTIPYTERTVPTPSVPGTMDAVVTGALLANLALGKTFCIHAVR